jgi:hypothetical protein
VVKEMGWLAGDGIVLKQAAWLQRTNLAYAPTGDGIYYIYSSTTAHKLGPRTKLSGGAVGFRNHGENTHGTNYMEQAPTASLT